MILLLDPPWPVMCPHGEGTAKLFIDRGTDINSEFGVRCRGGHFRFYFQPDIRIVGNPMDGHGLDLDIPKGWKK